MAQRMIWSGLVSLLLAVAPVWADVQTEAQEIIRTAGLGNAKVAVTAVDLNSGETLVAILPDEPMIPASNLKLITSAAAIDVLGPDFVFESQLQLAGHTPDGGAIIVIKGDGDPGWGDPELLRRYGPEHLNDIEKLIAAWADAVKEAGVTRISELVMDDRVFDQDFIHPSWPADQLHRWYCAQVAGFNFFDNCFLVQPTPTRVGEAPRITILPSFDALTTTNRAVTIARGDPTFDLSRKIGGNDLAFWGNVPMRGAAPAEVTLHDPPMTFGAIFAERLRRRGIEVGTVRRAGEADTFAGAQVLHRVRTPLTSVLARCNKNSQNLFADAMLKRMGRAYTGAPGGWNNGAAAVRAFLSERALGPAAAAAVSIADGSGLSRDNRVTSRILVDLLTWMYRHPVYGPIYRDSLSIAGRDGSLTHRLHNLHGQLYGKTGYINQVGSLSGYLVLPATMDSKGTPIAPERTIAFSIIINNARAGNHQFHQLQDRLVRLIDRTAHKLQTAATAPAR